MKLRKQTLLLYRRTIMRPEIRNGYKKKHYYIPEQKINDQSCFSKSLFTRTDHFDISANLLLCFTPIELKKQSSCSIQMINKTNHHVAFKVMKISILYFSSQCQTATVCFPFCRSMKTYVYVLNK
ncbi:putative PapD-like superfamily, immunoglobulin-like protein [Helianthus debilis subsp. tardiflorus]